MNRLTSALAFIGRRLRYLSLAMGIAALSACGQTGPLYLPEDTTEPNVEESTEQDQAPSKPDQSNNQD